MLAQVEVPTFWSEPYNSPALWTKLVVALLIGLAVLVGLMYAPVRARRPIVAVVTFFSGLYWVMLYAWPIPINRQDNQLPNGPVEAVGFWLKDSNSVIVSFTQILTALLFGLGIYSLLRIHLQRIVKTQRDWGFSVVLLACMSLMVFFGYADWNSRLGERGAMLDNPANWGFVNFGRDFLFEGLLQQMDAAMFSVIAFYILSAAYRAFRVRSVEATILLGTALIVILSLMGAVSGLWDDTIRSAANGNTFILNFQLTTIADWIRNTFQTSSLRGISFGVGIGLLAMGLRIWLSLERTGGSA